MSFTLNKHILSINDPIQSMETEVLFWWWWMASWPRNLADYTNKSIRIRRLQHVNPHPYLLMCFPNVFLEQRSSATSLPVVLESSGGYGGEFWSRRAVLFLQHWPDLYLHNGEERTAEPLSRTAVCGHTINFGFHHHKSWRCWGGAVLQGTSVFFMLFIANAMQEQCCQRLIKALIYEKPCSSEWNFPVFPLLTRSN